TCSVSHSLPAYGCVFQRFPSKFHLLCAAAWIGDMYFGLGSSKGAIVEHLYQLSRISSSHGSHYDQVHSGAVMIVTENVSSRSNRYDLDLHTKSARVSTTKETGVRLSTKT
uniref:Uncharacterized protein n=1 Tax=Aegilops tauschii subsp. strangulata TaxID=200361 RepID=A0A452XZI1_AEGTS